MKIVAYYCPEQLSEKAGAFITAGLTPRTIGLIKGKPRLWDSGALDIATRKRKIKRG